MKWVKDCTNPKNKKGVCFFENCPQYNWFDIFTQRRLRCKFANIENTKINDIQIASNCVDKSVVDQK